MSAESVPDPVGGVPEQNERIDFFLNFPETPAPEVEVSE